MKIERDTVTKLYYKVELAVFLYMATCLPTFPYVWLYKINVGIPTDLLIESRGVVHNCYLMSSARSADMAP